LFPLIQGLESNSAFSNLAAPPSLQQPSVEAPTMETVATPQDYATEAALSQLLGSQFTNAPLNQANASQAGTYQVPTYNPVDIQSYLSPLVEQAMQDVRPSLGANASSNSNTPEGTSEGMMSARGNGNNFANNNPTANTLENFLASLEGTPYAPSDVTKASSDQALKDYLNKESAGWYGSHPDMYNLNNMYTVQ
jgi:hypothetical protein